MCLCSVSVGFSVTAHKPQQKLEFPNTIGIPPKKVPTELNYHHSLSHRFKEKKTTSTETESAQNNAFVYIHKKFGRVEKL
jgi:hypothetical protein